MGKVILVIALSLFLVFCIFGFFNSLKMKKNKEVYGAVKSHVWKHAYGIPHLPKNALVEAYLSEGDFILKSGDKSFRLPIDSLTAAEYITQSDLLKKDKTVIGRGIVGGVLLGPLGAVVGGMSGIGDKKSKGKYLVLNYSSADDGETKVIIFKVINALETKELASKLTDRIIASKSNNGVLNL